MQRSGISPSTLKKSLKILSIVVLLCVRVYKTKLGNWHTGTRPPYATGTSVPQIAKMERIVTCTHYSAFYELDVYTIKRS